MLQSVSLEFLSSRNFILEYNAEHVAPQVLCEPPVLQDGDLEALALEFRVEICVDGPAHSLQDQQVHSLLRHLLRQLKER